MAGTLLRHTELHAAHEGTPLELWVIADNERALRTYERAGWTATDEVTVRNSSGRRERKYVHG